MLKSGRPTNGNPASPGPFGERIRRFRQIRKLSQEELAVLTGVSRNTVAGWETGHSRPDLNTVPILCSALKVSLARFFGQEKPRSEEERHVLQLYGSLEQRDREAVFWQMEALASKRAEQRRAERERNPAGKPGKLIPVFRNDLGVAAGFGAALDEACGEQVLLLRDPVTEKADEIIRVSGRSMEPTFYEGDQVLVQHTDHLFPGEIGVFLVDDEGFIKEYRKDGLYSHNPDYPVMTFGEHQQVRCVGRVLGRLEDSQIPSGTHRTDSDTGNTED